MVLNKILLGLYVSCSFCLLCFKLKEYFPFMVDGGFFPITLIPWGLFPTFSSLFSQIRFALTF